MVYLSWDARYDTDQYVYGKEPNLFFASCLKPLQPGKLLLPGEGEGRNAVFAATLGWVVDAFDQSGIAFKKAQLLMQAHGVHVRYQVNDITGYSFEKESYDAIGLIFLHMIPEIRKLLHNRVVESLKPGGRVILQAFHTSQLGNPTGGPRSLEMLMDKKTLMDDFPSLNHERLEEAELTLTEGLLHQGPARVVQYIGIKN
ncbi:MAG: class I SAM-dependent methyltransferase [Bacteroidota bacterium]